MGSDAIALPGEVACPQRAAMGRVHDAGRIVAAWASSRRAGTVEDMAAVKSDLTSCLVPAVAGASDSYLDDNRQLSPRSAARVFQSRTADVCTRARSFGADITSRAMLFELKRRLHEKSGGRTRDGD